MSVILYLAIKRNLFQSIIYIRNINTGQNLCILRTAIIRILCLSIPLDYLFVWRYHSTNISAYDNSQADVENSENPSDDIRYVVARRIYASIPAVACACACCGIYAHANICLVPHRALCSLRFLFYPGTRVYIYGSRRRAARAAASIHSEPVILSKSRTK